MNRVPDIAKCRGVPASTQPYGVTAAAHVPPIRSYARVKPTLVAAGFEEVARNKFQAADGSWCQVDSKSARWTFGIGNKMFWGQLTPIEGLPKVAFTRKYGAFTIAHLPRLIPGDLPASRAMLRKAGFSQLLPNYFSHPDGTWVAQVGKKLLAGYWGEIVTGYPTPGTKAPTAQPVQYPKFPTLPFPSDWVGWVRSFAVAKLPRADGSNGRFTSPQLAKVFRKLGFKRDGPGLWRHPDGSWAKAQAGRIRASGFQKWGFKHFPYSVGVHSTAWVNDTKAWEKWTRGRGAAPF
jgi:hypothetical protein